MKSKTFTQLVSILLIYRDQWKNEMIENNRFLQEVPTKLIKLIKTELKPCIMTRHRRAKINGLIESSQMLWGGG